MKKGFVLLVSALLLLFVISCNADPNIYKYDSSTYLGSWEVDVAPIQGDVDGCVQLQQYTFNSDYTYEVVIYALDNQTNEITIEEGDSGTYTFNDNLNNGGTIILNDAAHTRFTWNRRDNELSRLIVGQEFIYSRPKYVLKITADQNDIVGIWEYRQDDQTAQGVSINQLIFDSDGSFDSYYFFGTENPRNAAYSESWRYLDAAVPKRYSVSFSYKWDVGSDIVVSADSVVDHPLHEEVTACAFQPTRVITDNGIVTVDVLPANVHQYMIYECGADKYLADLTSGQTYKKVSDKIDISKKNREIVKNWIKTAAPPAERDLYLRSDGTFYSEFNLFKETAATATGYYGTYTENISESNFEFYLSFLSTYLIETDPATYTDPSFDWVAWRSDQSTAYYTALFDNDITFYKGIITFDGEYCLKKGGESFEVLMIKETPKYGDNDPDGAPETDYDLYIKKDVGVYTILND